MIKEDQNGSIQINDKKIINKFIMDPDFPFLISFPRTGSHWLRMLMELYFKKPALVRIFYYKELKEFTCCHKHDPELNIERANVIYLCREPVDTVYSQLSYYKEDIEDKERIIYWADLYCKHLSKWLLDEKFTRKKTVMTYEGLKNNLFEEFAKITCHFSVPFDREKLEKARVRVSMREVKNKTIHDKQVINLTGQYAERRSYFRKNFGNFVMERINLQDDRLRL